MGRALRGSIGIGVVLAAVAGAPEAARRGDGAGAAGTAARRTALAADPAGSHARPAPFAPLRCLPLVRRVVLRALPATPAGRFFSMGVPFGGASEISRRARGTVSVTAPRGSPTDSGCATGPVPWLAAAR